MKFGFLGITPQGGIAPRVGGRDIFRGDTPLDVVKKMHAGHFGAHDKPLAEYFSTMQESVTRWSGEEFRVAGRTDAEKAASLLNGLLRLGWIALMDNAIRGPVLVPAAVHKEIATVRESGLVNMTDWRMVLRLMDALNMREAAAWIRAKRKHYLRGVYSDGFAPAEKGADVPEPRVFGRMAERAMRTLLELTRLMENDPVDCRALEHMHRVLRRRALPKLRDFVGELEAQLKNAGEHLEKAASPVFSVETGKRLSDDE